MPVLLTLRNLAASLQWRRGVRAAAAVAMAMLICRAFGKPTGWAALGAFEAILVDNGGPYRSRLYTILTLLAGGAMACTLGSFIGGLISGNRASVSHEIAAVLATAAICFAFTFARGLTQPLSSTSVIILVLYFCGVGSDASGWLAADINAGYFIAGGLGAAAISLFLWPVDPFRPARHNVAAAYALLSQVTGNIPTLAVQDASSHDHDWVKRLRILIEDARVALSQTGARAPARTLRARNLTVLLETADMLFARTIRLVEMAGISKENDRVTLHQIARWLTDAENAIANALLRQPAETGESFGHNGSVTRKFFNEGHADHHSDKQAGSLAWYLEEEEQVARQELRIAFEAIRALWSANEISREIRKNNEREPGTNTRLTVGFLSQLLEKFRADWSTQSSMFRHAWRMSVVGAIDILLLRVLHINHGFWLGLTSVIVLQPNHSGTMRRGLQRVGGTIAGGIFAAALAATIYNQTAMLIVVTLCAGLTLASFAIDYGIYSFFLTPTFVLLSLPHSRDWHFAGVRILTTFLGALVSILAMRLLWPEREHNTLARLLHKGAIADAAYIRSVLQLWKEPTVESRGLLAQRRRACGLASNAAEETLDRLLLEPTLSRKPNAETERALAFTTYLRRLTQSTTTMSTLGQNLPVINQDESAKRMENMATRLELLHATEGHSPVAQVFLQNTMHIADPDLAELQLQRMERQVAVLERSTMTAPNLADDLPLTTGF